MLFHTIVILGFLGACQAQPILDPTAAVGIIRDALGGIPGGGMGPPLGPELVPIGGPVGGPVMGPIIPPGGGPLPSGPLPAGSLPDTPMLLPNRDTGMGDTQFGPSMGSGTGQIPPGGGIDTSAAYNLSFPISEIQRMLEGMNKGLFYDLNGRLVKDPLAQPIIALEELQNEMDKLSGSGAGFGPRRDTDAPSGTDGGSTITIEFTKPEVERMIRGMIDDKNTYDYQGKVTNATENVLSMKQLEMLMAQFEPPPEATRTITPEFSLEQVGRMINGTRTGRAYNYQGNIAIPGERTLNMDQLLKFLARFQPRDKSTYPFTLAQVQGMINGMNEGKAYNYLGLIASPGEPTLNMEQLQKLLFELQPSGVTTYSPFTLKQVRGMIDGMNQGRAYNYQGNTAVPGEPTLNMNQLLQLLAQLRPKAPLVISKFTFEQIETMIAGMNKGKFYNYRGMEALPGEHRLRMDQLLRLKSKVQPSAPKALAKFTFEEIEIMIDGMKQGKLYDYEGTIASEGETTLTMEQLLRLRTELESKAPAPLFTAKLTLEQIQDIIEGIQKGRQYNYQGYIASIGERTITMEQVLQLRDYLQNPAPYKTDHFTTVQIGLMTDGMNQGISYNYQGNIASEGETTLTMAQLLKQQSRLQHLESVNGEGSTSNVPHGGPSSLPRGISEKRVTSRGLESTTRETVMIVKDVAAELYTKSTETSTPPSGYLERTSAITNIPVAEESNFKETVTAVSRVDVGLMGRTDVVTSEVNVDPTADGNWAKIDKTASGASVVQPAAIGDTTEDSSRSVTSADVASVAISIGLEEGSSQTETEQNVNATNEAPYGVTGYTTEYSSQTLTRQTVTVADVSGTTVTVGPVGGTVQTKTVQNFPKTYIVPTAVTGDTTEDSSQTLPDQPLTLSATASIAEAVGPVAGSNQTKTEQTASATFVITSAGADYVAEGKQTVNVTDVTSITVTVGPMAGNNETNSGKINIASNEVPTAVTSDITKENNQTPTDQTVTVAEMVNIAVTVSPVDGSNHTETEQTTSLPSEVQSSVTGVTTEGNSKTVTYQTVILPIEAIISVTEDTVASINRTNKNVTASMLVPSEVTKVTTKGSSPTATDQIVSVSDEASIAFTEGTVTSSNQTETILSISVTNKADTEGINMATFQETAVTNPVLLDSVKAKITIRPKGSDLVSSLDIAGNMDSETTADPKIITGNPGMTNFNTTVSITFSPSRDTNGTTDSHSTDHISDKNVIDDYVSLNDSVDGDADTVKIERNQTRTVVNNELPSLGLEPNGSRAGDISSDSELSAVPEFTLPQIETIFDSMSQGASYNEKGMPAAPGDRIMTVGDLLRSKLDRKGPMTTTRLSYKDVSDMLDGMSYGNTFNLIGNLSAPGETTFTMDDLLRLQEFLKQTAKPQQLEFTLSEIEALIDGINQGMTYNDKGGVATGGEPTLTLDDVLRAKIKPNAPLSTTKLTYQDVINMLNGVGLGNSYNFLGMPAGPGHTPFNEAQLQTLKTKLEPKPPVELPLLTLADIETMIAGMDQGLTYNDRGQTPAPGDTIITREDLLRTPLNPAAPLTTTRLTYPKVREMMDGMGQGNSYNYLGMPLEAGQIPFTSDQLLALEAQLAPKPQVQLPPLTLADIERMIDGINQGMSYNDQGFEAGPGDTIITIDDLLRAPIDPTAPFVTTKLKYQDVIDMLNGMRQGNMKYNYLRMPAEAGQNTFTEAQLLTLKMQLEPKVKIQLPPLTLADIERMIDGITQGMSYNDQGLEAGPGDTIITIDDLLRAPIDPTGPLVTTKLKYQDVMDMLNGMRQGNMKYNYLRMPAEAGQNTFTEAQLLTLKTQLEPKVQVQLPPLTLADIERMIDGINQGMSYNDQGFEAGPGDTIITIDDLLRAPIDPTAPFVTTKLKYQDVIDMLNGMRQGNMKYNYLRMPAEAGQNTFTEAQLLALKTQLEPKGPIKLPPLALQDIESMIAGIDQGMSYNSEGAQVGPGESAITIQDLLRAPLDPTVPLLTKRLTYPKVKEMIDGIGKGNSYNYLGMPLEAGQNPFTIDQLLALETQLAPKAPKQLPPLTLADIERMINGINQGMSYNDQGFEAGPGDTIITIDDLLRAPIAPTAPISTKSLTYRKVTDMLDGISKGNSYNYLGMPLEAGQNPLSEAQLLTLKTQLEPKPPIKLPLLTLQDIEAIIAGMDQGMSYNSQGLQAGPNDPTITLDDLLRTSLDPTAPLISKTLTYQKVSDMIDGTRQGNSYNYLGMPAQAGQIPFTEDQLLDLEAQIGPTGPIKQLVFTLPDFEAMIEGMKQGIKYNDQGLVASPGDPIITRRDLMRATIDPSAPLTSTRFKYQKVRKMLEDTRNGQRYNLLGWKLKGRQTAFTEGQLLALLEQLEPKEFTLEEIESMIKGMEQGASYTPQGNLAGPGDPVMTLADLLGRKLKPGVPLRTSRFTYDKVQNMIDGMKMGDKYNYLGNLAEKGQYTFKRKHLTDLRSYLKPREFTLEEIESIIKGMEQGASYTPQGNLAGPGDPVMTLKDLLRRKLDLTVPLRTSRFTYDKIQSMIDGMELGDKYNYLGNLAEKGQYTFKRKTLMDLRSFLQPREFSLEEIETMIKGIEQGASYNPRGNLASPGDPVMTLKDLLRRQLKPGALLMSSRFTQKDVQDMIDAMNLNKNTFYNYLGQLAEPDQATFTLNQLLKLRDNLRPTGSNVVDINPLATGPDGPPQFTIAQVENMLLGMRNGMSYNTKGYEAERGQKILEMDYLERLLERLKLLASPDWKKAKLNSAICAANNCTLPSCYLPYDKDCKSYIVCQRQANGNYVAWKMRCAFGAYWGTGKVWTCERVEDLAKMGYRCQNDKCRDPNLKIYPDEEEKNCRTYWKCENGMSKPACCQAGYMFSRKKLKCVRDLNEDCRSPCPLKIEGCSRTNAKTQPFYDGNCRTYWDCEKGYPHPVCCKTGHRYDTRDGTCKKDSTCTHGCPEQYSGNVCGKMVGQTAIKSYDLDDGNCRTYFRCFDEHVGQRWCCRQYHRYNPLTEQCEPVLDQSDMCNDQPCPHGYKEECRLKTVAGRRTHFYDSSSEHTFVCPGGLNFSEAMCTCYGTVSKWRCNLGVKTYFADPENKWHVKNLGDGWISVYGNLQKNATLDGTTYGVFDGSNGMEVWRYDHAELPSIKLIITFWPRPPKMQEEYGYAFVGQPNKEILVSNCRSVDNDMSPSFEVSLDPATSSVVFYGQTKLGQAELRVQYDPTRWNQYTLLFDGRYAIAMIKDTVTGGADTATTQLEGDIVAGMGSLKFGPCKDMTGLPMNNGFVGYISEVIFAKCVDSDDTKKMLDIITGRPVP